jgi:hypothetical protein
MERCAAEGLSEADCSDLSGCEWADALGRCNPTCKSLSEDQCAAGAGCSWDGKKCHRHTKPKETSQAKCARMLDKKECDTLAETDDCAWVDGQCKQRFIITANPDLPDGASTWAHESITSKGAIWAFSGTFVAIAVIIGIVAIWWNRGTIGLAVMTVAGSVGRGLAGARDGVVKARDGVVGARDRARAAATPEGPRELTGDMANPAFEDPNAPEEAEPTEPTPEEPRELTGDIANPAFGLDPSPATAAEAGIARGEGAVGVGADAADAAGEDAPEDDEDSHFWDPLPKGDQDNFFQLQNERAAKERAAQAAAAQHLPGSFRPHTPDPLSPAQRARIAAEEAAAQRKAQRAADDAAFRKHEQQVRQEIATEPRPASVAPPTVAKSGPAASPSPSAADRKARALSASEQRAAKLRAELVSENQVRGAEAATAAAAARAKSRSPRPVSPASPVSSGPSAADRKATALSASEQRAAKLRAELVSENQVRGAEAATAAAARIRPKTIRKSSRRRAAAVPRTSGPAPPPPPPAPPRTGPPSRAKPPNPFSRGAQDPKFTPGGTLTGGRRGVCVPPNGEKVRVFLNGLLGGEKTTGNSRTHVGPNSRKRRCRAVQGRN